MTGQENPSRQDLWWIKVHEALLMVVKSLQNCLLRLLAAAAANEEIAMELTRGIHFQWNLIQLKD